MKERIAFVDYIRVIACLLVMVVHASEQFYNMGPVSQVVNEDNRLWVSIYDGFFGRISVPLFHAILVEVSAACGTFCISFMQLFTTDVYLNAFLSELKQIGLDYTVLERRPIRVASVADYRK